MPFGVIPRTHKSPKGIIYGPRRGAQIAILKTALVALCTPGTNEHTELTRNLPSGYENIGLLDCKGNSLTEQAPPFTPFPC
eukprot:6456687-Pyramimonas_sp.AAC.1